MPQKGGRGSKCLQYLAIFLWFAGVGFVLTKTLSPWGPRSGRSEARESVVLQHFERDVSPPSASPLVAETSSVAALSTFKGSCNLRAWLKGPRQKIISFSFYKSKNAGYIPGYWKGLRKIQSTIESFYPGWFIWIYGRAEDISFLQSKLEPSENIFYCDIKNLPPPLYNLEKFTEMMWRFAPMLDSNVDVVLFRDTDGEMLQREKDAVDEWLNKTNKTLHAMRDHPLHIIEVMGGLWGLRMNMQNRKKIHRLARRLFVVTYDQDFLGIDQFHIKNEIWPHLKNDALIHDSYNCEIFQGSSPWPTKRQDKRFVGSRTYRQFFFEVPGECPMACRPEDHPEWKYC